MEANIDQGEQTQEYIEKVIDYGYFDIYLSRYLQFRHR